MVRDNTLSVKRLYAGATPTQIFTKSNMTSSPVITYSLPKEDDVDEVVVNFTSPKTYKTETVYCHVDEDGNKRITSYPESDNQEQLDAWGVTDYDHAVALGMRRLRYLRNTRVTYRQDNRNKRSDRYHGHRTSGGCVGRYRVYLKKGRFLW